MIGVEFIAKLTDHWRGGPKEQYLKPIAFVLDEGGRQVPLRLLETKDVNGPSGPFTAITFRRM